MICSSSSFSSTNMFYSPLPIVLTCSVLVKWTVLLPITMYSRFLHSVRWKILPSLASLSLSLSVLSSAGRPTTTPANGCWLAFSPRSFLQVKRRSLTVQQVAILHRILCIAATRDRSRGAAVAQERCRNHRNSCTGADSPYSPSVSLQLPLLIVVLVPHPVRPSRNVLPN